MKCKLEGCDNRSEIMSSGYCLMHEQERIEANEDTPLSLSNAQSMRLFEFLMQNCHWADVIRIMKRIEDEV